MHVWPTLLPLYSFAVNPNRETGLTPVLQVMCQDFVDDIVFFCMSTFLHVVYSRQSKCYALLENGQEKPFYQILNSTSW